MPKGQESKLNDFAFLVSETDEKGIILFANDDFCQLAEYSVDELIGKPHSIVRHKDMPKVAFKDLWDTVKAGKVWTGYVKNATKSGGYYWVFATVFPTITSEGNKGYLSCRRKASQDEIDEHETLYKQLKNKE
ncbi:MAG: PAS domain-containing protein [Candidatus Marinarcus sp.]|uniref:PAS domain-containing protein n=1 Tax=Candidatus Marinarcus sp. TaxID=3100987 RepID=UPI003AFFB513